MADDFDPYQRWLGIPPQEQPPNYYRLLTLKPLETDLELIARTFDQLAAYLQVRSKGKNASHAQRLLDDVAVARACLLDPTAKAAYDSALSSGRSAAAAAEAVALQHTSPKRERGKVAKTPPSLRAERVSRSGASAVEPLADMSFLDGLGSSGPPSVRSANTAVNRNAPRERLPKWQPKLWQIGAAAGAILLAIVIAFVIAGQSKSPDASPRNNVVQDEPRFGNQTVDLVKLQAEQEAKRRIPRNLPSFAVPIHRVGDFFLTTVKINGEPAGDFLLDTGAEATAISLALAERLKLPEGDKPARIRAVGGGQTASFRKAKTFHLGEVRFDDLQFVAIDLKPWQEATGAKFDGVIGCDVWGELMFSIDPQLEKLTFYDRDRMPRGDTSGEFLTEIEHRPFVTVRLDGGEELQYMAATGCGHDLMLRTGGESPTEAGQGGAGANPPQQNIGKLTLLGQTFENLTQVPARWDDVYILRSDPRQAGVVGGHVLANFKLVMDIQRHKVIAQRINEKSAK
jgi:predicted aspartyl protease